MNKYRARLVSIGKKYFEEKMRPFLIQKGLLNNTLICFSGSIAYGYCDKLSDIEMEYYIHKKLNKQALREVVEILSKEGVYESVRLSIGLNTEWKLNLILNNKTGNFWKSFDPYQLFEMTHALAIWDPFKIIEKIKKQVAFYPNPIFKKVVRGLWITANDSGFYNADFSIKRGNYTEGYTFLYRGLEALLRLIYVLNREYYPHSKWLTRQLSTLKNNFNAKYYLKKINSGNLKDRYKTFCLFIKEFEQFFLKKHNIIERKYVFDPWVLLKKPYYIHCTF